MITISTHSTTSFLSEMIHTTIPPYVDHETDYLNVMDLVDKVIEQCNRFKLCNTRGQHHTIGNIVGIPSSPIRINITIKSPQFTMNYFHTVYVYSTMPFHYTEAYVRCTRIDEHITIGQI